MVFRILRIFLKWVLVEDVRLEKGFVRVLLHWTCLESLARCDRQAFPTIHRMILSLDRTESVVLGGLPPNHHEETALVTTAALSAKLCYPAIIEERDQHRNDNTHGPAIKLLDRDIQRHIRQKTQDQVRILLKSSNSATNPSVTGFSSASWVTSGRTRDQAFQSPSREKSTLARRRLCEPLIGNSPPVLSPKIRPSEGS